MSFLHFFVVFYEKYSDFLQVVFQCKKYSENTVENGTRQKTVIFTADIFAVYLILMTWRASDLNFVMISFHWPQNANTLNLEVIRTKHFDGQCTCLLWLTDVCSFFIRRISVYLQPLGNSIGDRDKSWLKSGVALQQ